MQIFNFHNKNVVLLIKVASLGGAERQALGLASYLVKEYACKVTFVATHSNIQTDEFEKFAKICGIDKVVYYGLPSLTIKREFSYPNFKKAIRAFLYLQKFSNKIKKSKPDILIPFLNTPSKIALLIYKRVGAKVAFWHQLGLDSYTFDVLEEKAIKKAPFILANAKNGLKVFKEKYNVEQNRMFILPQYISIVKDRSQNNNLLNELNIKKDAVVIVMVAHFREEKLHDLLISAFGKINTVKDIHLLLLGNKDNDQVSFDKYIKLKQSVVINNCQNRVSILSGVPVEKVLDISDIGVLVSTIEGTPTVVMEYMYYGLPVIATNHIGCSELLESNKFLIDNDEKQLIEKLNILIEDEKLRTQTGKVNVKIMKKYTIKNYVNSLESIINKTL